MNRIIALILLALGLTAPLLAQYKQDERRLRPVSVGIAFEHTSYVLGEDIPVRVLVKNNTTSELTLGLGATPSGMFVVSNTNDPQRQNLAKDPKGCLPKPLTLKANEERVFDLNLTQAVTLSNTGKYFVTFGAIVKGILYETKIKAIEIVPGSIVAEGTQLFKKNPNLQRHFTLVRWPRDHIDRLFLRIEDSPTKQFYPTVMLGAYLPLVKPRMNIADNGEVTILHRATPDYYMRNVFWSLTNEVVRRSSQSLLDPATADTARLKGMQKDLNEIIEKNDRIKEALRLR